MAQLTAREREVVRLLAQGQRQVDIARTLCVSVRTVESHVKSARTKTASASALALAVRVAVEEQGNNP